MSPSSTERTLRKIRSIGTFWIAKRTMEHLENIRSYELDLVLKMLPKSGRLLEIGAGTGWQAEALEKHGYNVSGIDLLSSNYKKNRVWPVTDYDGSNIPYEDGTFDIIFSSNTFEHIPHVVEFQNEVKRVLKDDGVVLHILPSGCWRFWTNITHIIRNWTIPRVHGELAKNAFSEIFYFRRTWWSKLFRSTGWKLIAEKPNDLFYTGCSIMDDRLNMKSRKFLSTFLGSSCNVFLAKKPDNSTESSK